LAGSKSVAICAIEQPRRALDVLMTPERYVRVVELFHKASDLDPMSRSEFLAQVCKADDDLRREVEVMLTGDEQAPQFLDESPRDIAAGVLAAVQTTRFQPIQIGHYRILGVLGEGGMGMVYEAEQDQPRRIVALKVIKPEIAVPELLRRFEQEAQALGRLHHPGIAQVYEAGTTYGRFGPQPYFAMELILSDSLVRYAEMHKLSTRQRLVLMTEVCDAVHHAHQRGIIHRDLKPGNILVDEAGQPKILDLGVARVTNTDAEATRQTDVGQIVGTLTYTSPEQVLADPMDLDIRSDVYALGVILFELLAGTLPYKIRPQLPESIRTICEEDPTRLGAVSRAYRGDIETIVGTALEKDRARRYSSAEKLGSDILRYLRDEPITARRPSATYRLQKFTRRHKALVTALAAIFLVLIGGIVVSTRAATRARRAEQVANAVNDFLRNDLLAQASGNMQTRPGIKADRDLKVRTALNRAAARISERFKTQPLVEASKRQTMANTYGDLGLYPDGQRQAERAFDLRRQVLGEKHPDTLNSMHYLAIAYLDQGKLGKAEIPFKLVLETRRRARREPPGYPNGLRGFSVAL
jgi:serine/threonine protein kinase